MVVSTRSRLVRGTEISTGIEPLPIMSYEHTMSYESNIYDPKMQSLAPLWLSKFKTPTADSTQPHAEYLG